MAKCLKCGAGPEWLQGNPPKMSADEEISSLRTQLAAERAEREKAEADLKKCDIGFEDLNARLEAAESRASRPRRGAGL